MSLVVLLCYTNFINKLKFNDYLKTQNQKYFIDCTYFFNLQNHPTFYQEQRLVKLVRGREIPTFLVYLLYNLHILLVYGYFLVFSNSVRLEQNVDSSIFRIKMQYNVPLYNVHMMFTHWIQWYC